jgi:prophage regulatory protein
MEANHSRHPFFFGAISPDFGASPMTPALPRILRLPEVMSITGLSRSSVQNMMRAGAFPRSIKLSVQARGWRLADIVAWIETREAA